MPHASIALTSACAPPYRSCQPSPRMAPSRAITAPTSGLGFTAPAPLPASSIARARYDWSVSVRTDMSFQGKPAPGPPRSTRAARAVQTVDGELRARPLVGERVVVEAPVEAERDGRASA